eukprot:scaffold4885_cov309-Prasinococcus_capsulatus_cf.AAC.1
MLNASTHRAYFRYVDMWGAAHTSFGGAAPARPRQTRSASQDDDRTKPTTSERASATSTSTSTSTSSCGGGGAAWRLPRSRRRASPAPPPRPARLPFARRARLRRRPRGWHKVRRASSACAPLRRASVWWLQQAAQIGGARLRRDAATAPRGGRLPLRLGQRPAQLRRWP